MSVLQPPFAVSGDPLQNLSRHSNPSYRPSRASTLSTATLSRPGREQVSSGRGSLAAHCPYRMLSLLFSAAPSLALPATLWGCRRCRCIENNLYWHMEYTAGRSVPTTYLQAPHQVLQAILRCSFASVRCEGPVEVQ